MRYTSVLVLCLLLLSACKKEEGEGGKAEINGTVMRQDVNGAGNPQGDPYPYQDTRVYIVYGDHEFQDDDVRTGPDGQFAFRWLRKGTYTIYTYGECDCPGNSVAIERQVTIDGKKDVVTVPVITADNFLSFLRHIAFVGLSWACIQGATAQENTSVPVTDGQVWMSLGVGYKPFAKKKGNVVEGGFRRNFKLNGEVEWRTREWASETKQVNFTFAPEYKVTDFLKVAVQYRYALKDRYTDNVHRIGLQASLSWGTGRLKLDSRTRYEHEFKPVNKIRDTFRERLGVEYNIPHWKLDPHVSAEMFYALHYTENRLGGMRYELGTDLALDKKKKRTLGLAVRYDQEVNTVAPGNAWILIFAFEGSFKKK